jgi:hypothetical protein
VLLQALVLAAIAIAAIVLVALPLLREPSSADALDVVTDEMRARLEAAERRDSALAALSELEFDHRTGAVSDEDYRAQVGGLRRAVADALAEAAESPRPPGPAPEADASRGYHRRA